MCTSSHLMCKYGGHIESVTPAMNDQISGKLRTCLVIRYMTFADCRLQTADWRPQIADCKLKDTKTLPNKGDTIKNITSCESEKVAWEQG